MAKKRPRKCVSSRFRLRSGISVGHWSDTKGRTGCTMVLAPDGGVAGVDVRGGAPGTLSTDALAPGTLIERAKAVLLTGGSLFGLAAATGVMSYLEERGAGRGHGEWPTATRPIVRPRRSFSTGYFTSGVTTPWRVIWKIVFACASATRRFPLLSTAIPCGLFNGSPLTSAATLPSGVTCQTACA